MKTNASQTRRRFLQGSGIVAAANAMPSVQAAESARKPALTLLQTDVLVCGG
ncbi:MAG: hypothetical protein JWO89_587, partial [Verrucomicrobiaceae bacterium]|nr:hypothetical protein [Verrucomicrobiaceae bacterium]